MPLHVSTDTVLVETLNYRKITNISRTKSKNLNVFRLGLQFAFAQYTEARCYADNEDEVGAAPTGDAPTTSEWSTI